MVAVIPPAGSAHGNAPPRKLGAAPQGSEGPRAPAQAERGVPFAPTPSGRTIAAPAEPGHAGVATPKLSAASPQGELPAVGAALADPAPVAAEPRRAPVVAVIPPAGSAHANAPPRKLGAAPHGSEGPRAPAQAERAVPLVASAGPASVGAALADPAPVAAEPRRASVVAVVPPVGSAHANAPPRKLGAAPHASEGPRAPAPAERAMPLVAAAGRPPSARRSPIRHRSPNPFRHRSLPSSGRPGTAHANAPPRKLAAAPHASEARHAPAQAERSLPSAPPSSARIIVAPAEPGHASVATPKLSAVAPQGELPAVGAPLADPAPLAVALAPVALAPVVANVPSIEDAHANAPARKLGAAPQGSDAPRTPVKAEPAAPGRLAALPPPSAAPGRPADAPVISVLRGGPHVRYAQTGRPQGAAPAVPAITVIRGGRSRPVELMASVTPDH